MLFRLLDTCSTISGFRVWTVSCSSMGMAAATIETTSGSSAVSSAMNPDAVGDGICWISASLVWAWVMKNSKSFLISSSVAFSSLEDAHCFTLIVLF